MEQWQIYAFIAVKPHTGKVDNLALSWVDL
jgi:hypothetical protein